MPRDGSLTLSDVREPTLTIACERCGRHGRYNAARLTVQVLVSWAISSAMLGFSAVQRATIFPWLTWPIS